MQNLSIENSAIRAASRDKNYWREMVSLFEKSNEHPKDFCARVNIKLGTLSHWRGVFKKERKPEENKFIEIKVKPKENVLERFIIECPTGHKIIFSEKLKINEAQVMFKRNPLKESVNFSV